MHRLKDNNTFCLKITMALVKIEIIETLLILFPYKKAKQAKLINFNYLIEILMHINILNHARIIIKGLFYNNYEKIKLW